MSHLPKVKRNLILTIALVFVLFVLGMFSYRYDTHALRSEEITQLSELDGQYIGVLGGASYESTVAERFPNATIVEYASYSDMIRDLKNRRIVAYMVDKPQAAVQIRTADGIRMLNELLTHDTYGFVLDFKNIELRDELNVVLSDMKKEGLLDALATQWIDGSTSASLPKEIVAEDNTPKKVLRVATDGDSIPFSYFTHGELNGYDIAVIREAARRLNYSIQVSQYSFGALLNSVVSEREDIAVGGITCTEERCRSVLFTDSVYSGGTVAVLLDTPNNHMTKQLQEGIELTLISENRWKQLAHGMSITVGLSLVTLVLGSLLGFLFSFSLRSSHQWIRVLSMSINTVLGTLPLLIILMILYYVVFVHTSIPAIFIGIIGLTLDFANTVAGLLDAGIRSVDRGQLEAADAMGYRPWQAFLKIAFPQAVHHIYPHYADAVSSMVKGTSIVGYITVQDLTNVSDSIRNVTFQAFFPLVFTAVMYFLISMLFSVGLNYLMMRLSPGGHSRRIKGVNE